MSDMLRGVFFTKLRQLALALQNGESSGLVYYHDKPLVILPSVFDPMKHWSGELLADNLVVQEGDSVLDMGTGSGLQAICAAAKASHVVACDINPMAVKCARANAVLNGVEDKIEFRRSDLFKSIAPDEQFDLIIFNMPFFFVDAKSTMTKAYLGGSNGEVVRGFWRGVVDYLAPNGKVQITFSGTIKPSVLELEEFAQTGLKPSYVAERRSLLGHRVCVYVATR